ncbi:MULTISPECIES: hypothetical protein [unclassified Paenarthrobacter]|uniref:hypothetical protein n=1 Tax=Paenarthrobacter TaxID=1742992 RepID=UPI0009C52511|nr:MULTISPECIES: hypothetical protein [unclassified Paenarthrobacter]MDI2019631.1 hypothetical protein [Paenarthrobacter nicotinovorans]QOT20427.1 hypothetical protein HMI60_02180 [Paenarthrobacter sp. YJN-D]SKB55987.1 hypothetical protein SAMN05660916_01491 [Arthrobacter sp. 31Cvi3.1E]
MNASPDHSGSHAIDATTDRWTSLWEPAARRYQPLVDQTTPTVPPAASPLPGAAAQA